MSDEDRNRSEEGVENAIVAVTTEIINVLTGDGLKFNNCQASYN
jgi:hypothetical protein